MGDVSDDVTVYLSHVINTMTDKYEELTDDDSSQSYDAGDDDSTTDSSDADCGFEDDVGLVDVEETGCGTSAVSECVPMELIHVIDTCNRSPIVTSGDDEVAIDLHHTDTPRGLYCSRALLTFSMEDISEIDNKMYRRRSLEIRSLNLNDKIKER